MNVYLLANMATQHGPGTQAKNKVSGLANASSSFIIIIFYNHLVDSDEMPFRSETTECKTSKERSRFL